MDVSSDPVFVGYNVTPKRISGLLTVSRQLLVQQTGRELNRILIGDLSRQLASYSSIGILPVYFALQSGVHPWDERKVERHMLLLLELGRYEDSAQLGSDLSIAVKGASAREKIAIA